MTDRLQGLIDMGSGGEGEPEVTALWSQHSANAAWLAEVLVLWFDGGKQSSDLLYPESP